MTITMSDLEEAAERVMMGPERRSRVISDNEKRLTAYHEGGHTLVGMLLDHTDPVHKVTIIPRGRAGGYTLSLPKEDRYYATRSELLDELKVLLGGRVAEALVLHEISSGASNDLQRATELARQMTCEYGMSERLGAVTFGHRQQQVFLGRDIGHENMYSERLLPKSTVKSAVSLMKPMKGQSSSCKIISINFTSLLRRLLSGKPWKSMKSRNLWNMAGSLKKGKRRPQRRAPQWIL